MNPKADELYRIVKAIPKYKDANNLEHIVYALETIAEVVGHIGSDPWWKEAAQTVANAIDDLEEMIHGEQ